MKYNNFYYALTLLKTIYGLSISEDDFEEIALIGWDLIGNKRARYYKYSTSVDPQTNSITLPCNADILKAVTTDFEEWDRVTGDFPNGNLNSSFVESYIEGHKKFTHPLYIGGKYINFERVGNTLYFDKAYPTINILYQGEVLDNDGLPEITDKEAMALATYCAWILKYREGLATNNANLLNIASTLKLQWDIKVDLARVDHQMTLNDWDEILDAKTNWNRKSYNRSLKPHQ